MITCQIALCADRTIQDATTNSISLIGVLERIRPVGLPFMLAGVSCYFVLNRDGNDPEQIDVLLRVKLNDLELARHQGPVSFQGLFQTRLIINFFGFPITSPGLFQASLSMNDQIVGSYEFTIEVPTAPAQMILPTITRS